MFIFVLQLCERVRERVSEWVSEWESERVREWERDTENEDMLLGRSTLRVISSCWLSCASLALTGMDERTSQASWAPGGESSPSCETSRVRWPSPPRLWMAFMLHSTLFNTHYIKVVQSQCHVVGPVMDIFLCDYTDGRWNWFCGRDIIDKLSSFIEIC